MDRSVESAQQRNLEPAECIALLASQQVARLVFVGPIPEIRPVNYVIICSDIFVRTDNDLAAGQMILEVDDFDAGDRGGWSVIVDGHAELADDAVVAEVIDRLTPWAPGAKSTVSRIVIDSVSGRWVRAARLDEPTDRRGYL